MEYRAPGGVAHHPGDSFQKKLSVLWDGLGPAYFLNIRAGGLLGFVVSLSCLTRGETEAGDEKSLPQVTRYISRMLGLCPSCQSIFCATCGSLVGLQHLVWVGGKRKEREQGSQHPVGGQCCWGSLGCFPTCPRTYLGASFRAIPVLPLPSGSPGCSSWV